MLCPQPGEVVFDGTAGRGGHARAIWPKLVPGGRYIGVDVDPANIAYLNEIAADAPVPCEWRHANFADGPAVLQAAGVAGGDGVLVDLGFASVQVDDPDRGLSFSNDGPLDMRLDPSSGRTAADLIAELDERSLADLIFQYGEERLSRPISRKIVAARAHSPIKRTGQLAELCAQAYGARARKQRIHPATRTFQALRIAVNDELGRLESLLDQLPRMLRPGGRAVIISFHSLEDRMVKQRFRQWADEQLARRLTKKPLVAENAERAANPRSRSAKLRAIKWIGTGG